MQVPSPRAQQDMLPRLSCSSAELINYHIVGEYNAGTSIASDHSGQADVTDRVEIDLTWNLSETALVGTPVIKNTKSIVTNPHDRERSCLAPVLKGDYEHFELLDLHPGLAGGLEMQVRTTYPTVQVAHSCTARRKSVPAKEETRPEEFLVPSPVMLAMGLPPSETLSVSLDKTAMIRKNAGWTWTYIPTIAPAR